MPRRLVSKGEVVAICTGRVGILLCKHGLFLPGRMSRNSNEIKEWDTAAAAAAVKNTAGPFVADSRNLIRI